MRGARAARGEIAHSCSSEESAQLRPGTGCNRPSVEADAVAVPKRGNARNNRDCWRDPTLSGKSWLETREDEAAVQQ